VNVLFYYAAGLVFLIGVWGIVTSTDLIHAVGSLSVAQSSTYLLLLAVGYRHDATAPVFSDVSTSTRVVDPLVQAMTLTDVVVGATVTALLLSLVIQIHKRHGTIDPNRLSALSG
jgi:multicomponent Na+:H+ antiporter subunit C